MEELAHALGRPSELGPIKVDRSQLSDAGAEEIVPWEQWLPKIESAFAANSSIQARIAAARGWLASRSDEEKSFSTQWLWVHDHLEWLQRAANLRISEDTTLQVLDRLAELLEGAAETYAEAQKIPGTDVRVVKDRPVTSKDLQLLERGFRRLRETDPHAYRKALERTRTVGLFELDVLDPSAFIGPFGFTGMAWPSPWKSFIGNPVDDIAMNLIWGSAAQAWHSRFKEQDLIQNRQFKFSQAQWVSGVDLKRGLTPYRYLRHAYTSLQDTAFLLKRARYAQTGLGSLARRTALWEDLDELRQLLDHLLSLEGKAILTPRGERLVRTLQRRLNRLAIGALPLLSIELQMGLLKNRAAALNLYGHLGLPRAVPLLHYAAQNPYQDEQRALAVEALSRMGGSNPLALSLVVQALKDKNKNVRVAAIKGLGRTGNPEKWTRTLKALLDDPDAFVRFAAAEGLAFLLPLLKNLNAPAVLAITAIHPEWLSAPPAVEEFAKVNRAIAWLPPVGGKIPLVNGAERELEEETLSPSWSAEEQAKIVMHLLRSGLLGREYVHQLTVQGRLPDEFKYAAMAIILSSPYRQDWTQPFFKAHWGKVAPLVHDGGNVQVLNPLWSEVPGRTDFLQRVSLVYGPDQLELEKMEAERLVLETKAYQRLALALHAAQGTAPRLEESIHAIPEEVRQKLAARWREFRQSMDHHLGEFGLAGPLRVRWFFDQPQKLEGWLGSRREASWRPIQKELLKLNRFADRNPQQYDAARLQVVALLKRITDDIDRDLGLLPPLPAAAGMEEKQKFLGSPPDQRPKAIFEWLHADPNSLVHWLKNEANDRDWDSTNSFLEYFLDLAEEDSLPADTQSTLRPVLDQIYESQEWPEEAFPSTHRPLSPPHQELLARNEKLADSVVTNLQTIPNYRQPLEELLEDRMNAVLEKVRDARRRTPRHLFLPRYSLPMAYEDRGYPIGYNQTISQPTIVDFMLAAADLKETDRVLEVGGGSGYLAAQAAQLAGHVDAVELIPELAQRAGRTLHKLSIQNATILEAGETFGNPAGAPYDVIIVSAGSRELPLTLLDQLAEGGRMIIPVYSAEDSKTYSRELFSLRLITKEKEGWKEQDLILSSFVPLKKSLAAGMEERVALLAEQIRRGENAAGITSSEIVPLTAELAEWKPEAGYRLILHSPYRTDLFGKDWMLSMGDWIPAKDPEIMAARGEAFEIGFSKWVSGMVDEQVEFNPTPHRFDTKTNTLVDTISFDQQDPLAYFLSPKDYPSRIAEGAGEYEFSAQWNQNLGTFDVEQKPKEGGLPPFPERRRTGDPILRPQPEDPRRVALPDLVKDPLLIRRQVEDQEPTWFLVRAQPDHTLEIERQGNPFFWLDPFQGESPSIVRVNQRVWSKNRTETVQVPLRVGVPGFIKISHQAGQYFLEFSSDAPAFRIWPLLPAEAGAEEKPVMPPAGFEHLGVPPRTSGETAEKFYTVARLGEAA